MNWLVIAKLIGGLVILTVGAEILVRGAARLAATLGMSPLLIGLTIVAYGTSAPELAVSLHASVQGNTGIAIANVVGSNIFNVLCALGVCALITPLAVSQQLVRIDVPIMIGVSVLIWLLSLDGALSWIDGAILLATILVYTTWTVVKSRQADTVVPEDYLREYSTARLHTFSPLDTLLQLALVGGGLCMLLLGASWLVDSAVRTAHWLGVSDEIVGLTVVAVGTSLPELTTSLVATIRHEQDIAIGHIIGSNIFNVLGILGLAAVATPGGLTVAPSMIEMDIPIMVVVAICCLPIFFTGFSITRWEGFIFLASYIAYTTYLVLDAYDHDLLHSFTAVLLYVALPLAGTMIIGSTIQALHKQRKPDTSLGPAKLPVRPQSRKLRR